ncbi:MAG: TraB/GumN family protein [Mesorhizobium sp.]
MKKVTALADHLSAPLLWLVALANLLFIAAFVATLLLLGGQARAETEIPACKGADMLPEMAKDDAAGFARMQADAAATPNGVGLLWKVEKAGAEPSFLFGTMHMTDPRVVTLPTSAQTAFDAASTVVIETTDVLDQSAMTASLMASPELMMFTDGTTLTSLMSPDDAKVVEEGLAKRGIPAQAVERMKPWMLTSMLAVPACELARKAAGAPVLDVNLAEQAKVAGKEIAGLETAKSQIEAMASLPIEFHVEGLVETMKLGDRIDDVIETMIEIYKTEATGLFVPFMRVASPDSASGDGYAVFEEKMITSRNVGMAKNSEPFLDKGKAFIAVGAMHLPGDQGLVELLRKDGYTVTRVD